MLNRVRQVISYIFNDIEKGELDIIEQELSTEEFNIFSKMDKYDQVHCIRIYKRVIKDDLLKDSEIYRKLALLHDCGKENIGLFRRIKHVLIKDMELEVHPELGYRKLRRENSDLAELVALHHSHLADEMLKRFQKLDDLG